MQASTPHAISPAAMMQPAAPTGARVFTITVHRHTGLLVLFKRQTVTVKGTFEQCEAAIKAAQSHNLVLGWWSPLSMMILNWLAILANRSAMSQLRSLAAR
jgi:hypothetical protein